MKSLRETLTESFNDLVFTLTEDDLDVLRGCADENGIITLALGVRNHKDIDYLSVNVDGKWEIIRK